MNDFEGTIRPKFKQHLPKKLLLSKRVKINKGYECSATFWIPDTPYSKEPPKIGLTMRHGKAGLEQHIRFVFSSIEEIRSFFGSLNVFALDCLGDLEKVQGEAMEEWRALKSRAIEAMEARNSAKEVEAFKSGKIPMS
jgi:hypothetical protein